MYGISDRKDIEKLHKIMVQKELNVKESVRIENKKSILWERGEKKAVWIGMLLNENSMLS